MENRPNQFNVDGLIFIPEVSEDFAKSIEPAPKPVLIFERKKTPAHGVQQHAAEQHFCKKCWERDLDIGAFVETAADLRIISRRGGHHYFGKRYLGNGNHGAMCSLRDCADLEAEVRMEVLRARAARAAALPAS